MKHEWRKKEKSLYIPSQEPVVIDIQPMSYCMIKGKGHPGSVEFSEFVGALYGVAYGIRMLPKKGIEVPEYYEYTVYPLEGIWDYTDEGRVLYQQGVHPKHLKEHLTYTLMIRQPAFVTSTLVMQVKEMVMKKKKELPIESVYFDSLEEGKCIQMLHIGSYDDEPESFKKMSIFANEHGFKRKTMVHKEIYLSDPKKTAETSLKTTLRFQVSE